MGRYHDRHFKDIMAAWHSNAAGMGDTVARLCAELGWSSDKAWAFISRDCAPAPEPERLQTGPNS